MLLTFRIRVGGWWGLKRLQLERIRDRLYRRILFRLRCRVGQLSHLLGEKLYEFDARHTAIANEVREQEERERKPVIICHACGLPIGDAE